MRGYYFVLSIGLAVPVWIAAFFGIYIELIPALPFESIAAILTAVVLFPVLEELVFRGLLWDLWGFFARKKGLNCIGSCKELLYIDLFLFASCNQLRSSRCGPGFYTKPMVGLVKRAFRSIKVCCLVHVLWNLGYVGVLFLGDTLIAS